LKGKVLATNAIGGAQDMAARAMLRKHGLEFGRDFTDVEVAFPNMKAVLAEKKADLIVGVKPFTEDPSLRSIARTLFTQRDAVGTTEMIVWTARQGYLQKHRAALVDFMEDVVRSYHWYLDPANHDEVIAIVARFTKQPPERLTGWVFTRNDYYRTPDAMPDLDALQKNIDMQRELGFLKDGIDIKRYADLGILMEAAKRVHP
jgi:NitT/TauT family transport system substrate-binding protein